MGKNNTNVYVSSYSADGTSAACVVCYREQKGNSPLFQPAYSPVVVPKPNEDYFKVSWPEPEIVLGGLAIASVAVASYYIGKAIIAVAAYIPTGGLSFLLLCF